ncbi:MAG: restriction endonuclease subunit S [Gammaproteobacteria bacterium]|nr:restriction endonuclease subunit S [Gammaproteobacteria bacterium]
MGKHTKTAKLSELADIRTGHPFRGSVEHTPTSWDYYVLQLKDVQKDCHISLEQAAQVSMTDERPPQPLQPGDILLRARGGYYYSGLFSGERPNVIAAAQFFILTPDIRKVAPAYLCWYLNQPASQQYFERNDTGTNISMINKRTIRELLVTLPSLATQHKIATIHQGWLKEKTLTEQLLHNREQMVRGLCQAYINRDFQNRDAS